MNEFKSKQVPTKEEIEKAKEQEKQQRKIEHNLKLMRDAQMRRNKELILLCYEKHGKLTDLEKDAFLGINETTIPEGTYLLLYHAAKEYIEKGDISKFEEYKEKYKKEADRPFFMDNEAKNWAKDPKDKGKAR